MTEDWGWVGRRNGSRGCEQVFTKFGYEEQGMVLGITNSESEN